MGAVAVLLCLGRFGLILLWICTAIGAAVLAQVGAAALGISPFAIIVLAIAHLVPWWQHLVKRQHDPLDHG